MNEPVYSHSVPFNCAHIHTAGVKLSMHNVHTFTCLRNIFPCCDPLTANRNHTPSPVHRLKHRPPTRVRCAWLLINPKPSVCTTTRSHSLARNLNDANRKFAMVGGWLVVGMTFEHNTHSNNAHGCSRCH